MNRKMLFLLLVILLFLYNCGYKNDYYVIHTFKYSICLSPEGIIPPESKDLIYITILQIVGGTYIRVEESKEVYDLAQEYKVITIIDKDFRSDEYIGVE